MNIKMVAESTHVHLGDGDRVGRRPSFRRSLLCDMRVLPVLLVLTIAGLCDVGFGAPQVPFQVPLTGSCCSYSSPPLLI